MCYIILLFAVTIICITAAHLRVWGMGFYLYIWKAEFACKWDLLFTSSLPKWLLYWLDQSEARNPELRWVYRIMVEAQVVGWPSASFPCVCRKVGQKESNQGWNLCSDLRWGTSSSGFEALHHSSSSTWYRLQEQNGAITSISVGNKVCCWREDKSSCFPPHSLIWSSVSSHLLSLHQRNTAHRILKGQCLCITPDAKWCTVDLKDVMEKGRTDYLRD